jgi:hypothetical protein
VTLKGYFMRFVGAAKKPTKSVGPDIIRLSHELESVLDDLRAYEHRLQAAAKIVEEENNE